MGPYRLLELSSEDALGPVYLAEHPRHGDRVTLKVLTPSSPDAIERFFRAARVVNALQHERIAEILDLGTLDDGRAFVVMERLRGVALSHLLERYGTLPIGALARILAEVLDAVAAAHAFGIVHGALSPDRIFVSTGHATVIDFGVGALLGRTPDRARRTRQLLAARASRYRAPEQASGEADPRSDLYAIGAILFEGVTGQPPFDGATISEVRRSQTEAARPARSLRASVSTSLEGVIQRALAKEPEDRFADARQMATALAGAARELPSDEPWLVQPLPSAVLRPQRREPPRPAWFPVLAFAAAATFAVIAVIALAFG